MGTMREILEQAARTVNEGEATAGINVVERMAKAMLNAPALPPVLNRIFDTDQIELFNGLLLEPLTSLIAKAIDVAGGKVQSGLMTRAGREMKSVARGELGAQ